MATAQSHIFKVIDQSRVAPPPGSVSTTTVPLTFFDIKWYGCYMHPIYFYEFSCTTLHFTQTVLPRLKESLSQTLRHFFPLAANFNCPLLPNEPNIFYNEDSSLQVTVVESDADFNLLASNHARDIKSLQSLVPKLPSTRLSSKTTQVVPVMAIQFTVFPNSGICIGLTTNHGAADGRSMNHFVKFWGSIHRSQGEDLTSLSLPYCNKDIIKDSNGISSIFLKDLQSWELPEMNGDGDVTAAGDVPDYVMVTLELKRAKIDQLKHCVKTQSTTNGELDPIHVSSFVVACAFMWVNILKLQEKINGKLDDDDDDDKVYNFLAPVDCRERFLPQVPANYFGNCLTHITVPATKRELMGESGIVFAAKAIGKKIYELGSEGALKGVEKWMPTLMELFKQKRVVTVASSPKFQVYDTDFGWGKLKKFELVPIDASGGFFLNESRDGGGYDVGVVIEKDKMDIFNVIFEQS